MKLLGKIWQWLNTYPVGTIVFTAILFRIAILFLYGQITPYPDSEDYIALGNKLLHLDLSGYEGERSPGYPFLLALFSLPFFSSHGVILLLIPFVQMLAGIFTLILLYKICLIVNIRKEVALAVSLFFSCYLPTVFFEFAILTESLTLLVVMLVFYYFFRYLYQEKTIGKLILVTLLCTYLVLIKPFYIFLPFILFAFLLLQKKPSVSVVSKYLIMWLIPLLAFLGWSYVNKVNTGHFVSTTFYGFNLAQNCVSFAEKTTPKYREIGETYARYRDNRVSDNEEAMVIWDAYFELLEKTGLSYPDLSALLYDYSIATIKKNPVSYLKQVFVSWRDFWKTSLYWERYGFGVSEAAGAVLYISYAERILLQFAKILFVLLIPYNIVVAVRQRQVSPVLVISVVVLTASVLQAFATYGTNSRFSYPFEMLMVVSVVLNMVEYIQSRKKKKTV
ncbi:4-amino-4-deoxy-L-arabinose transferase-like glycosyltransferase [Dysgonomonas sp. PFB1-18]|uniref:glycosyltransferase family 39 protein n=1 Tax=unclassified Dysgonomonas TaxID=2630389 RepID=UPI00247349C1|nr:MULTISPECIES: glycosyltransferase family 39 protein [unclassified Dysgonomonas]MDH6308590.1 4-amino-4-deoxy-L-arabinose transferase-like glycosyltransferase [Dysgonomonas sp. PF1-14]MDH6338091.1 4-amino-4-deoxy-L-arabinose transferase-like glycosyltransferase [Dysgonomonas sp. PF1-16]MDH6379588.1 4-amino-4-deoxy-L-arabinose transferase-like glycosyltransferase [Dysgonomonas sp. PFB1-18]MDH6396918.1 4-amino-4-deoxy-L-arabinose transferase-like glycosyltransferase [Dysgonomonas sp. PF1-23]